MTEDISSPGEFTRRLERFGEELVVFVRRLATRRHEAEDVLQSALATAWKLRRSFVEGTNFRAWVYRIVVHEAQNANRKSSTIRHPGLPPEHEIAGDDFWEDLEREAAYRELLSDQEKLLDRLDQSLAEALRRLGDSERLTLLLRAVGGFTCAETAEILQIPKGTVMARLFRARAKLRRWLGAAELPVSRIKGRSEP